VNVMGGIPGIRECLHEGISADYTDMVLRSDPQEIEVRRNAFICKWRLKHRAVVGSLED
jgi:putative transposase